jgi:hypothetical protein
VTVRNFHRWCLDQLSLYHVQKPTDGKEFNTAFAKPRIAEVGEFVFTRKGSPVTHIYNSGWKSTRRHAAARYEPKELLSGFAEAAVQSN